MSLFTLDSIGYVSDPVPEYVGRLRKVKTLTGLMRLLKEYEPIAWDGLDQARAFQNGDFEAFLKALQSESRGRFCGEEAMEKFGAIILPVTMLKVGMIATHFGAPWGCAYIRCLEDGHITVKDGRAVCNFPKKP